MIFPCRDPARQIFIYTTSCDVRNTQNPNNVYRQYFNVIESNWQTRFLLPDHKSHFPCLLHTLTAHFSSDGGPWALCGLCLVWGGEPRLQHHFKAIRPARPGQAQPPTSRNQVAFNKIRREVSPTASVSADIYDRLIKVNRIIRMIMTVLPSSLKHNLQKTKLVELYKISQLTLFNLLKREVYCRALKQDAGLVTSASTFTPT